MGSPVYSYAMAEHMQEPFVMLGEMIRGKGGGGGMIGAMVLMVVLVGKGSIWGECMFWKVVMRFARKEQNGRWGRLLIVWGKR